jgi:hypothetical protein
MAGIIILGKKRIGSGVPACGSLPNDGTIIVSLVFAIS